MLKIRVECTCRAKSARIFSVAPQCFWDHAYYDDSPQLKRDRTATTKQNLCVKNAANYGSKRPNSFKTSHQLEIYWCRNQVLQLLHH
jgi:hypothetical protein